MVNEELVQAAFIAKLKSMPDLTAEMIGVSGTEIREYQWQGVDFIYPAIRVYVDVYPSINGCGPDRAEICAEIFTDEKSSKKVKHMGGILLAHLHKHRFKSQGLDFSMVRVVQQKRAERSIFAWQGSVTFEVLVSDGGASFSL